MNGETSVIVSLMEVGEDWRGLEELGEGDGQEGQGLWCRRRRQSVRRRDSLLRKGRS